MTFLFSFSTELRDGDLQTLCQILKTHDYLWTKRMEVEAIGVTCGYGVSIFLHFSDFRFCRTKLWERTKGLSIQYSIHVKSMAALHW